MRNTGNLYRILCIVYLFQEQNFQVRISQCVGAARGVPPRNWLDYITERSVMESIHSTLTTFHRIWANVHQHVDALVSYLRASFGRVLSGMHLVFSISLLFDFIFHLKITRLARFHVTNGLAYLVVQLPPVLRSVLSITIKSFRGFVMFSDR